MKSTNKSKLDKRKSPKNKVQVREITLSYNAGSQQTKMATYKRSTSRNQQKSVGRKPTGSSVTRVTKPLKNNMVNNSALVSNEPAQQSQQTVLPEFKISSSRNGMRMERSGSAMLNSYSIANTSSMLSSMSHMNSKKDSSNPQSTLKKQLRQLESYVAQVEDDTAEIRPHCEQFLEKYERKLCEMKAQEKSTSINQKKQLEQANQDYGNKIDNARKDIQLIKDGLEEGYTGEIPVSFNGIDDDKMKDLMKDYYTNISRASRSLHSINSNKYQTMGQGAKMDEALAEISAVQNYPDSQDSMQASGIQVSLKTEESEDKRQANNTLRAQDELQVDKADCQTKKFENVPYMDLLSETQRILIEQTGHCQITIQEIEKELTNSKLPQLQECISQQLDQQQKQFEQVLQQVFDQNKVYLLQQNNTSLQKIKDILLSEDSPDSVASQTRNMFSDQLKQIEEIAELDAKGTKEHMDALNEIEEWLYEIESNMNQQN